MDDFDMPQVGDPSVYTGPIVGATEAITNLAKLSGTNIGAFAEKLASKLPGELKVCYFVNSGSEANDLALLQLATPAAARRSSATAESVAATAAPADAAAARGGLA